MNYLGTPKNTKVEIPFTCKVRGRYKMEAVKADGSRRLLADWFDNLVTNNGLDLIGSGGGFINFCLVGSGNTAPTNADTALVSFVAATGSPSNSSTIQPSTPFFSTLTMVFRFAIGVATGNLSEVGTGPNSSNSSLFSRALILDGGGSPTTITVLSSEALDVTYQIQQYVPLTDVTGSVTVSGVSYAYTARASIATNGGVWVLNPSDSGGFADIQVFNGAIGAITAGPSGASASTINATSQGSYSAGQKHIDSTFNFGLADGNVSGGIGAVQLVAGRVRGTMGAYQVGFTPSLPKDGSHTMTLVFRHSWDRH